MKRRLLTVAARTAAAGGVAVLCLGGAQAAQAKPSPGPVVVPCYGPALSSAIADAGSGTTLVLVPGCTYVLTAALPDITTDITIDGYGATVERSYFQYTPDFTIFSVDAAGTLNLNDVNVRHGGGATDTDGAIYNDGTLMINGGTFSGNTGDDYGGAIYNDGTLTISHASFRSNTSLYAGAIYSEDYLTVTDTTFTGNVSTDYYGGAVYNDDSAQITGSTFTANSTNGYGGAIYNEDVMTVTGSTFIRNQAEYGGAIYNEDVITLNSDTLIGNQADQGGGFYNGYEATVNSGTVDHNQAGQGGGFYNYSSAGWLDIYDAQISFNGASGLGGGIYSDATLYVADSAINSNTSTGGGGIYNGDALSVTLSDTQIAGNTPDSCEPLNTIPGCTS
jgi:predicted outer membrane repeat protein